MMNPQAVLTDVERAQTYRALAECYYPPDEALIAMLAEASRLAPEFVCEIARKARDVSDLESLRVDHARLFIGPFKLFAAPYGSVYLDDGRLMGDSTLHVKGVYAEEGLDTVLKVAPDHIAVEMEFMVHLIGRTVETGCGEDRQRAFLARHLGRWSVAFAVKVEEAAETEFYRTVGNVTQRFMEAELTRPSLPAE